ncbi:MAG TPA: hypothetical protein DF409_10655 [Bacteroidales bacterium]|nr:hypothetical protein [Bacteroidales bacterium]
MHPEFTQAGIPPARKENPSRPAMKSATPANEVNTDSLIKQLFSASKKAGKPSPFAFQPLPAHNSGFY